MTRPSTALLVVVALLGVSGSANAQEPPVTDDAVARVGGEAIRASEFDKWLRISLTAASHDMGPLDPPAFARCVSAERRKASKRGGDPSRQALVGRCKRRYGGLRDTVMEFLVQSAWVRQEARLQGIAVRPERVRRVFERQRRQAFPQRGEYRRFLKRSGTTEADIVYRVQLDVLQSRLAGRAAGNYRSPTSADVDRYLAKHRRRLAGIPPRRARSIAHREISLGRSGRALADFVADFRERYRAQTACLESHRVPECGAVLAG